MCSILQSPLQTSHSGSLSTHPFSYLALRQPCLLSCLEQGIKQRGLLTFDPLHLCPNPTSAKKLVGQLLMCPHV